MKPKVGKGNEPIFQAKVIDWMIPLLRWRKCTENENSSRTCFICAVACTHAYVETFQWTTKYNSRFWSFFATLHLRLFSNIALDPYALITCEGRTVRTPTISSSSDPYWNSGALFFVRRPKKTHLLIQVRSYMVVDGPISYPILFIWVMKCPLCVQHNFKIRTV